MAQTSQSGFRFSITHMLLMVTLCGLICGLVLALIDRVRGRYEPHVVAFSPAGQRLAVAFEGREVRVWDLADGHEVRRCEVPNRFGVGVFSFLGMEAYVNKLQFDDEHEQLYAVGRFLDISRWPLDSKNVSEPVSLSNQAGYTQGAFSSDGRKLAAAPWGTLSIELWDLTDEAHTGTFSFQDGTNYITSVSYAAHGSRIAAACDDGGVEIWNVADATPPEVVDKAVGADDDTAAPTEVDDPIANQWRAQLTEDETDEPGSGQSFAALETDHDYPVVLLSADGGTLAVAQRFAGDGAIQLWDVDQTRQTMTLDGGGAALQSFVFSPDGKTLAATHTGGQVRLWDTQSGKLRRTLGGRSASAPCVTFSPDGKTLAVGTYGSVAVVDLADGAVKRVVWSETPHFYGYVFGPAFILWAAAWGVATRRRSGHTSDSTEIPTGHPLSTTSTGRLPESSSSAANSITGGVAVQSWLRSMLIAAIFALLVSVVLLLALLSWISASSQFIDYLLAWLTMTLGTPLVALTLFAVFLLVRQMRRQSHKQRLRRAQKLSARPGSLAVYDGVKAWFAEDSELADSFAADVEKVRARFADLLGESPAGAARLLALCFHDEQVFADFDSHASRGADYYLPFGRGPQAVVCDQAARRRLTEPRRALRTVLGYYLLHNHKGFLPLPWLSIGIAHLLADESDDAQARLARRIHTSIARNTFWPMRTFFFARSRAVKPPNLGLPGQLAFVRSTQFFDQSCSMVQYLTDDSDSDLRRGQFADFLLNVRKRDQYEQRFTQHFGYGFDQLLADWTVWAQARPAAAQAPPPDDIRHMLVHEIIPQLEDNISLADRIAVVRRMGSAGYATGADRLIEYLRSPYMELRGEALWALEAISGRALGPDVVLWAEWWESLPGEVTLGQRPDVDTGAVDAIVVGESLESEPPGEPAVTASSVQPEAAAVVPIAPLAPAGVDAALASAPPKFLQICWALMAIGGIVAVAWTMFLLFAAARILVFCPLVYYGLWLGCRGIGRASGRRKDGLTTTAVMQMVNLIVCDSVNFILGAVGMSLLRELRRRYNPQPGRLL